MNHDLKDTGFKWETPEPKDRVNDGDLRIVSLPVKVVFEWSDKIVADYDSETDKVLEYTTGYIMNVLPHQNFVFKGEKSIFLAQTIKEA